MQEPPRLDTDLAAVKGSLDGAQRAVEDVSAAVSRTLTQLKALTSALDGTPGTSEVRSDLSRSVQALATLEAALRAHAPDALPKAEVALNEAAALLAALSAAKSAPSRAVASAARTALTVLSDAQALNRTATTSVLALLAQAQATAAKAAAFRRSLDDTADGRKLLRALDQLSGSRQQLRQAVANRDPFAVSAALEAEAKGFSNLSRAAWRRFSPDVVGFLKNRGALFDVQRQVATLKPGERYWLDLEVDVHRGAGVNVNSRVEVARGDDGVFTISAQGQVGANLTQQLVPRSAKTGASLAWQGLVGGGVTLSCASAEDARRVVALLTKVASKEGTLDDLTAAESSFLSKQVSGLELSASAAAQVVGELGLQTSLALVEVTGRARGAVTPVVRVELERGRVTGLQVRETITGTARASGVITPGGERLSAIAPNVAQRLTDVETTLSLESHVSLPVGITLESVVKQPGQLRGTRVDGLRLEARSLKTAGTQYGGPASEARVSLEFDPSRAPTKALLHALLDSDYAAAKEEVERSGEAVASKGSLTHYNLQRLGLRNVGGHGVVDVDATFEARRLSEPRVELRW